MADDSETNISNIRDEISERIKKAKLASNGIFPDYFGVSQDEYRKLLQSLSAHERIAKDGFDRPNLIYDGFVVTFDWNGP